MKKCKISVLIGIYNCQSTLQEALDSLYNQTCQDFKIILCDDGSEDDTFEIALRNRDEHPDTIILIKNEKNMGLNYTLNHCLEYADTEYCARMDGDDTCDPTRFEKEVAFLDTHPEYAIVSCGMTYFDEYGTFGKNLSKEFPGKDAFIYGTPFCHAPSMVRTKAYKAVNGYSVSKYYLRCEDYHLWAKMYAKGYKGYNLQEYLYAMRDDRNAIARRKMSGARNQMVAHLYACRVLCLPIKGYIYSFFPILKMLLPKTIYTYFHRRNLGLQK